MPIVKMPYYIHPVLDRYFGGSIEVHRVFYSADGHDNIHNGHTPLNKPTNFNNEPANPPVRVNIHSPERSTCVDNAVESGASLLRLVTPTGSSSLTYTCVCVMRDIRISIEGRLRTR